MLITRGTRGDVQPFVALARGLALHCNCEADVAVGLSVHGVGLLVNWVQAIGLDVSGFRRWRASTSISAPAVLFFVQFVRNFSQVETPVLFNDVS